MQSIHNTCIGVFFNNGTVCDISKIRNVVNSQRVPLAVQVLNYCLRYIKDTKCSQFTTYRQFLLPQSQLFAIYQRYEMQSIHNCEVFHLGMDSTVCDISKIRNVVNSQQPSGNFQIRQTVCDISKIRNVVNSQPKMHPILT